MTSKTSKTSKQVSDYAQSANKHDRAKLMKTLKQLLGYEYHVTSLAFELEDTELVFINNFLLGGQIRVYLDGELVLTRWTWALGWSSDSEFSHNGIPYRIFQKTTNWFTCAQEVTVYQNGVEVGRKVDGYLADLNWKQLLHAMIVPFIFGGIIGIISVWFN